jgi:hypothetical protein
MPNDTGSEIDEILGGYGIVRIGKKPPFGLVNIESDTLFEELSAYCDKRIKEARIDELEEIWGLDKDKIIGQVIDRLVELKGQD